jgi:exonuclease III
MKIVTWNCQQAFLRKAGRIFSNAPDIAVIQECSERSAGMTAVDGYAGEWVGDNSNKGMAVFWGREWSLQRHGGSNGEVPKWIVPFEVHGRMDFTLIAVWACAIKGSRRESYVGQIHKALRDHAEWFRRVPVVMAGDFNSNAIFDRKRPDGNHSSMVDELRDKYGLMSVYHWIHKQKHGAEETPTFHLYRRVEKPYHFDYIFVPIAWRRRIRMEIGRHCDWGSESDHCPLTVEVLADSRGVTKNSELT